MRNRHLFGPVPSRRLGVSLGVDLIPHKTCSLNCVYCECGKTTNLTLERREYVKTDRVINELNNYLSQGPPLDYITFAGSGEPTLHSRIGDIIAFLKENYANYPLCLLTNGTLFHDPYLRKEVSKLDLIIPSLDAASEKVFQAVNRPHKELSCSKMIEGLVELRKDFPGEMRLEVFIVPGLNDTAEELGAIKAAADRINPDSIQLGTLDRPGTEDWVEAATNEDLKRIASYLGRSEIIGEFRARQKILSFKESYSRLILQTLRRRPCTIEDLNAMLGIHPAEVQKYVNHLLEEGKIEVEKLERGQFLKVRKAPGKIMK